MAEHLAQQHLKSLNSSDSKDGQGMTTNLDAETVKLVSKWRANKTSIKATVAHLVRIADEVLSDLQTRGGEQKYPTSK